MPGNPLASDPIKHLPYIRLSINGTKYGPFPILEF
jgi:hypothetical protein